MISIGGPRRSWELLVRGRTATIDTALSIDDVRARIDGSVPRASFLWETPSLTWESQPRFGHEPEASFSLRYRNFRIEGRVERIEHGSRVHLDIRTAPFVRVMFVLVALSFVGIATCIAIVDEPAVIAAVPVGLLVLTMNGVLMAGQAERGERDLRAALAVKPRPQPGPFRSATYRDDARAKESAAKKRRRDGIADVFEL